MNIKRDLVSIIGVPTEIGTHEIGTSLGPHMLRANGVCQRLTKLGFEVKDFINIDGPVHMSDSEDPVEKLRHALTWYRSVKESVYGVLQENVFPLIIGGDHSISIGSIAAISNYCEKAGRPLCVLWFDAHADFNTFETTPSGNLHGMPLAAAAGFGHADLLSIGHKVPLVKAENIYQVGIRSIDAAEKQLLSGSDIQVFDMRHIDEMGMHRVMSYILDEVEKKRAYLHVSFDIDCLDPLIAPGTGTTIPGGLHYREAQLCMEMIYESGLMQSLEVVELNPLFDIRNQTSVVAVELIESLFGKAILPKASHSEFKEVVYEYANSINRANQPL